MSYIFYLVGPPASGKRTIGKLLAQRTGAALLDNHLANDPIFAAVGADGLRPLPEGVWPLAERVHTLMHEALLLAPPAMSHILTSYLSESDEASLQARRDLAQRRGATLVPVWLECPLPELKRRVPLPERAERRKLRDVAMLDTLMQQPVLPAPADALVLDTSRLTAEEAVEEIVRFAGLDG